MTATAEQTIQIENWRPADRGNVKATFTVNANGTKVHECRLLESHKGLFVTGPQRSYEKDGERRYVTLVEFGDAFKKRIASAVLAKYQAECGQDVGDDPPFMGDR